MSDQGFGGFQPRNTPPERRAFFDIAKRQSLIIQWLEDNFIGGLIIKGRVPTEADLPLPPPDNRPGDGYLTDDPADHLWIWVDDPDDPPARWIDTGPFNSSDHNNLTGVEPDQHHSQAHNHGGSDGSGQVQHGSLLGVTPDQHHNKQHAHDGDGSGTMHHYNVASITADDHHPQVHIHDGLDGSGTVLHSDTVDIGPDDHHPKVHAHDGLDGSGTVAHADTTGWDENTHHNRAHDHTDAADGLIDHSALLNILPDQHHDQVHLLYGTDHSDIDSVPPLQPRHLLAQPPTAPDQWGVETRMNWLNTHVPGLTYYRHDVVTDGAFAMVANKETTDRPAPQPTGDPIYTVPEVPAWQGNLHTGTVFSGVAVTPPAGRLWQVQGFRLWIEDISSNAHYRTVIYDATLGTFTLGNEFDGDVLQASGWLTASIDPVWIGEGSNFVFLQQTWNSAGTTDYNHPWIRIGNSNTDADPGAGNWNTTNQNDKLRISATDDDGTPRQAELAAIVPGTIIRPTDEADLNAYTEYSVVTVSDQGGWFLFDVQLVDTGGSGAPTTGLRQQVYFEVPLSAPTEYVDLPSHYLNQGTLSGYLAFDDITSGATTNDAYGADVLFQEYSVSEDWDLLATSSSGSGEGGSGVNPLPPGGITDQALTKINNTDYNVQWSGPYWDYVNLPPGSDLGSDRQVLVWDTLNSRWKVITTEASLSIIGTVADAASLPPGPHPVGNAWITADTGHLWVWAAGPPEGFSDAGPYNITSHTELSDILPDDHHPRYTDAEAIAAVGPHFSGLHTDLTSVTPDQHHNQVHLLVGPDHSDVNDAIPLVDKYVLVYNAGSGLWEPSDVDFGDIVNPPDLTVYVQKAGDTMTGALLGANGTAAAPQFSFSADPASGMLYESSFGGTLQFAKAGVTQLRLTGTVLYTGAFVEGAPQLRTDDTHSAAAPAFSFVSDNDTGFFQSAANQIGVSLGGIQRWNFINNRIEFAGSSGTGAGITLPTGTDVGADTSMDNPLNIGDPLGANIAMDGNEIMFRNNGAQQLSLFGSYVGLPDGSAAAPSLRFLTDTDTGIYLVAEAQIGFAAAGARVADVINDANGARLRAPSGTFSFPGLGFKDDGDTGFYRPGTNQIGISCGGEAQWLIGSGGDLTSQQADVNINLGAGGAFWGHSDATPGSPAFSFSGDKNSGMYQPFDNSIGLATAGVERVYIGTGSVNVGARATGTPELKYAPGTAASPSYTWWGDPNTGMYRHAADDIGFAAGGNRIMSIHDDGIYAFQSHRASNGTAGTPSYSFTSDTNTGFRRASADEIGVSCGGANQMLIRSGTGSNGAILGYQNTLTNVGTQFCKELTFRSLTKSDFSDLTGGGSGMLIQTTYSTDRHIGMYVYYAEGDTLVIRNYENSSYRNILASAFTVGSSAKTKTNVRTARDEGGLLNYAVPGPRVMAKDQIRQLRPVIFDNAVGEKLQVWDGCDHHDTRDECIAEGGCPGQDNMIDKQHICDDYICGGTNAEPCDLVSRSFNRVGLIAEEVAEVFPRSISKDMYGEINGIDYAMLTVEAINVIQHLADENDELEQRIATLEAAVL